MIEVLLVTGPLGAGKTTVVNRLLRAEVDAGRRAAVLINEFGAVSVDGALVNAERPELAGIANLVNGCVCCSLKADVVAALAAWCDLPEAVRPQRVVLETTGLADPTDLLDLELEAPLQGRLRLAGCLTVISALTPVDHLQTRTLLRHQAALASLVLVSKADLDPSLAVAWEGNLRSAHPGLPILPARLGELPPGAPDPWAGDLRPRPEGWTAVGPKSFAEARSLTVAFDHPVDPAALEQVFFGDHGGGELLRAKGILRFDGWPPRHDGSDLWAFQLADGRLEVAPLPLAEGTEAPACAAVVIGIGMDFAAWRLALRKLERPPSGARRKVVLPYP
ncbi:MAG: GTP-binding protein [Holophagaceae bacterium]|nr:GTP-binding protein [Holophagaceae bacterium]